MDSSKPLEFHVLSWHADDAEDEENKLVYGIKMFGKTRAGESVAVTVSGFQPYFYIRVDDSWSPSKTSQFEDALEEKCKWIKFRSQLEYKKDFWGFSAEKSFGYLRLTFDNLRHMRKIKSELEKPNNVKVGNLSTWKLYEANIDPFLRFIHNRDLDPAGWVRIPAGRYRCLVERELFPSSCKLDYIANWKDVHKLACDDIAPFKIASFDIECTSSHGDFPVAKKDYRRLAYQLLDVYYEAVQAASIPKGMLSQLIHDCILKAFGFSPVNPVKAFEPYLTKIDHVIPKPSHAISEATLREKLSRVEDLLTHMNAWQTYKVPRERRLPILADMLGEAPKDPPRGFKPKFDAPPPPPKRELYLSLPPLEGDPIIQIGITTHTYGEKDVSGRMILTLGSCDPIEGVTVKVCEDEGALLRAFTRAIDDINPDIITGYNILGFDFEYIYLRAQEVLGSTHSSKFRGFMEMGRLQNHVCEFKTSRLSSSALGDNFLKYIHMEGRVIVDVMAVVKRDHKLDSFKLDNVAHHFIGLNKHDISPNDIFRLQRGSSADRKVIAEYCIQDCALCNKLIMKLEIVANNMGMANVCSVPLSYIFMRGQGIKIFSLVMKQCSQEGFVIPVVRAVTDKDMKPAVDTAEAEDDSYEGAIVLEPKEGIYIDDPVSVLDYASLYPSSMISENLSHDCIVTDPKYDNLPGYEYVEITYDMYEGKGDKKTKVGEKKCRFAQLPDGRKGMIPNILMQLLKARKTTRKRMEQVDVHLADGRVLRGWLSGKTHELRDEAGEVHALEPGSYRAEDTYNDFQKAVLDGLQLAYKVTANSLYGQCGAKTSPIYLKEIAAATTATGRKMIMMAKDFLESNYNANIVYGDSVTGYTPVVLRVEGDIRITAIDKLAEQYGGNMWIPCVEPGKQEKEGCELSTPVEVWTDAGWTRLHRVIRHTLAPHKSIVRVITHTGVIDVTDDHSLMREDGSPITPKEASIGTKLLHCDLPMPRCSTSCDIGVDEARNMGMSADCVPACILNAPIEVREAFWDGMCHTHITTHHTMVSLAGIYTLATSLGYHVRVEVQGDIFQLMCAEDEVQDPHTVQNIQKINYTGYVYDLTTENHHFAAGIGRLIAHNTDSIFVIFPDKPHEVTIDATHDQIVALKGKNKIMPSINMAIEASSKFKKFIKPPHDLEYEKTFWPFILLSKKRYVGNLYEMDDKKCKQKSMGIVLKRRDNAPIVKRLYGGVIDIILNKQDIQTSIEWLKTGLEELIHGRCSLEDLVITKSLRADYIDPERIAHKVLAERMAQRDPGNKPQVNDRIPYVYIDTPGKDKPKLQGDRIEAPSYVIAKKLKPDYQHYITNQIMQPILQLYAIVIEHIEKGVGRSKLFYDEMYKKILQDLDGDEKKAKEKLMANKEKDVKQMLFDPIIVKLENMRSGNQEITRWFPVVKRARV